MPTPKPMIQSVKILLSLCLLFHFSVSFSQTSEKMELNLKVKNIKKSVGVIYITVYDNEEDYMENRYAGAIAKVESEGSLEAV
jgi:uncharacterized protein (DUF2141 family)